MAFIANDPNLDENEKKQGQPILGGASSVINTQAFSSPDKRQDSSGRFVNLQNYLQTNQQQAGELGNKVAGKVEEKAEGFKSQLGQAQEKFGQKVDENRVIFNQQAVDEAVSDPTKFVQDADKVQQFAKMRDANYQGPSGLEDLEDYQGVQSQYDQANEYLKNSQSESGRNALLKDTFNRSSYTGGQAKLDQLLLQNDSGARDKFAEVQNKYSGLSDVLNSGKTQAQEAAKLASQQTAEAKQKTLDAFGREDDPTTVEDERAGAFGQMQSDLQSRVSQYNTGEGAKLRALDPALRSYTFSDEQLSDIGLTAGQRAYNVNLVDFIPNAVSPEFVNEQTVATSADYDRYKALNQLLGRTGSLLPSEQVGQVPTMAEFDAAGLRNQIKAAEDKYNSDYSGYRGGVLDSTLFVNPNADPALMIPWNRVDPAHQGADKFRNASPKELAEYWYPLMNQLANETGYASERQNANAILQSVRNWQAAQGYNNVLKKK